MVRRKLSIAATAALFACFFLLAGCAPTQATEVPSTGAEEQAVAVEWSMEGDCTVCHSSESESASDTSCLVSSHEERGMTCVTCHDGEEDLKAVHEGATADDKMPKKLKKTTVASETCLTSGCHSQEELKTATEGVEVLTDAYGTVVNPHDMPVSDSHASVTCANCHVMHKSETADETAPAVCMDCHHAGVYECGTCHEL